MIQRMIIFVISAWLLEVAQLIHVIIDYMRTVLTAVLMFAFLTRLNSTTFLFIP